MRILLFFILGCVLNISCTDQKNDDTETDDRYSSISGNAQGTTYTITFNDSIRAGFSKQSADSIFEVIDDALSVWKPNSVISRFNSKDSIIIDNEHFLIVYFRGKEISQLSGGAFQPMIMPLVRAWGFGPDGAKPKGDVPVDSLLKLVNEDVIAMPLKMDDVSGSNSKVGFTFVKKQGQQIDVNGIAQGYSVDVIAEFLRSKGVEDYMVEVGGEVRAKGLNGKGNEWRIGIDKPLGLDEQRDLQAIVSVSDRAIATSGSYRKFYEADGKKRSHTIDPATGQPVNHPLLSTTVMASNCTNADAFATAFMVMGTEKTKAFLADHPELGLSIYLIFSDADGNLQTYMSPGMEKQIEVL